MTPYTASAVFASNSDAANALTALHSLGMPDTALSVLTPEPSGAEPREGTGESVLRQLLGGGALGAGLGVAALALPGVGPLVAAGAIAAAATAEFAVLGAGAGALTALLGRYGVDQDRARRHDGELRAGGVLLLVDTRGTGLQLEEVQRTLDENGGFGRVIDEGQRGTGKPE